MTLRFCAVALLALGLILVGSCTPRDADVGSPCSVSECPDADNPPDNANTVCEPAVQCQTTFLCLGEGQGPGTRNIDQFCTIDCDPDAKDACPDGFECQAVADVGQNAGRTLCVKPLPRP